MRIFHAKRAFTLTEMLVCVLCIGLLTAAIIAFYAEVNSHAIVLNEQKKEMMLEYSDISRLQNRSSSVDLELINLNNPQAIIQAGRVALGSSQKPQHGMSVGENQVVIYEPADSDIAHYTDELGIVGVSAGVTYFTVTLCNVMADGSLAKTTTSRLLPVHVFEPGDSLASTIVYYFYNGQYVDAWVVEQGVMG